MNATSGRESNADTSLQRTLGVFMFVFALVVFTVVSWRMATSAKAAKAHKMSYDEAVKQIDSGNVASAEFGVSQSEAVVSLVLRGSAAKARLTIPNSSIVELSNKLKTAGAPIVITEGGSHGWILLISNLLPLFLILGLWFLISFVLMKKRKPAMTS